MLDSPFQTSAGHIEIDGQSMMIARVIDGRSEVGAADERSLLLDVPAIYNDFSLGLGATERFIPGMYGWGHLIDTFSCPGVVLPAGEQKLITGLVNHPHGVFGSWVWGAAQDLWFTDGPAYYKIANGSDTVAQFDTAWAATPGTAFWDAKPFNANVYLGSINATTGDIGPLYKWDGTTHLISAAANVEYQHLVTADWAPTGTPRPTLIANPDPFHLQWVTGDPMVSANWAPAAPGLKINDGTYHIRGLFGAPQFIVAGTQEGVRTVSASGRAPNLTPYWANSYDIESGAVGEVIEGNAFVCHAFQIDRVRLTGEEIKRPTQVWPLNLPFKGPFAGRCTAMTTWMGWLIVAIYNPTTNLSYVLFGRDNGDNDPPMIWHGAYSTITGRMTHMRVSSPTTGPCYLYQFSVNEVNGQHIGIRQDIPRSANSYQDLTWLKTMKFTAEGAYMILPDGWPEYATASRNIWRQDVEAQRMMGSQTITVHANRDGNVGGSLDMIWDEIGQSNESGRSSTITPEMVPVDPTLPDGDQEAFGAPARLMFKVDMAGTTTAPPVFLSLRVRADINFETPDLVIYTVDLRQNQETGIGTEEVRQVRSRLEHLKRMAGITAVRVGLRDENNITWRALVLKVEWPSSRRDHDVYDVQARVYVRKLYRNLQWDSGEVWGGDGYPSPGPWG